MFCNRFVDLVCGEEIALHQSFIPHMGLVCVMKNSVIHPNLHICIYGAAVCDEEIV